MSKTTMAVSQTQQVSYSASIPLSQNCLIQVDLHQNFFFFLIICVLADFLMKHSVIYFSCLEKIQTQTTLLQCCQ